MAKAKQNTMERRQAVRAKRVLSIQFRLVKSRSKNADTRWYISSTHDMSAHGVAFLSEVPYRIGDIIELNTVMSGVIDVAKGYGQVKRVEEKARGAAYLIAVKFINHNTGN